MMLVVGITMLLHLLAPCSANVRGTNHHPSGPGRQLEDLERMGEGGMGKMNSKKKGMGMMKRTVYGDASPLGDGYIRTFAVLEGAETTGLGIKFDLDSLENLPTTPSDGLYDIRDADGNTVVPLSGHTYELNFPDQVASNLLPFRHAAVNWNPNGHPPPEVYTIPHFDFHFYTITSERRNTCVLPPLSDDACPLEDPPFFASVDCAGLAFYTEPLPADQTPAGYILVPGPAEPAMGNHLIPVTSAEFQEGGSFTHTWIYGVEGGNINFYEPMITIDYLRWLVQVLDENSSSEDGYLRLGESLPVDPNGGTIEIRDHEITVKVPFPSMPEAYPEAGMYPTSYQMSYNSRYKTFAIALTDYVFFPKSSLVKDLPCPGEKKTFYGDASPLGDGYIRTFAVLEGAETTGLGIKFNLDSLENLPTTPSDGLYDIRDADGNTVVPLSGHTYELNFPDQVASNVLPFRHAAINWNPNGHPPPEVYTIPHFDFHFYTITSERRNTCVLPPLSDDACPLEDPPFFASVDCAGLAFYTEPLPADQTPAGYILVPGPAEPAMGNHLIPVTSAEFQEGGSFTHTWIYGVEGGNINFYEPMITIDYLRWLVQVLADYSTGDNEAPVDPNGGTVVFSANKITVKVPFPSIPEAYPEAGMYPTSYHISYDSNDTTFAVVLTDYVFFPMSSLVQDLPCPNM